MSVGISVRYIYSQNQKDIHTIIVLVLDFLLPCISLQPSQFQPFLQQTSSPRPIWLQHCIVESIVDPCCPTPPPHPSIALSSSSTASLQVSQTKLIALTFIFGLDWVTLAFGC